MPPDVVVELVAVLVRLYTCVSPQFTTKDGEPPLQLDEQAVQVILAWQVTLGLNAGSPALGPVNSVYVKVTVVGALRALMPYGAKSTDDPSAKAEPKVFACPPGETCRIWTVPGMDLPVLFAKVTIIEALWPT